MTYSRTEEDEESSMLFNNDLLGWTPNTSHPILLNYTDTLDLPPHQHHPPDINTTNPMVASNQPLLDPNKQYHPEWGVIKEQDFHPLTMKHQRDLENLYQTGSAIRDFYFWQANLGGYCMADMIKAIVLSAEGMFVLERKIVEGAPHPGRRKKKRGLG
ncbi:hypothetical protein BDB01DRAFT_834835 [Pilobolus umbonatus]|nr:hypothetical protein BDB01DRAFT_834835 [Pilobolus umbonatus]